MAGHGCGRHLWAMPLEAHTAQGPVGAGRGKAASAHFVVQVVRAPTRRTPPDRVVELPGSESLGKRQPLLQILILFFNLRDHTRSPDSAARQKVPCGIYRGASPGRRPGKNRRGTREVTTSVEHAVQAALLRAHATARACGSEGRTWSRLLQSVLVLLVFFLESEQRLL